MDSLADKLQLDKLQLKVRKLINQSDDFYFLRKDSNNNYVYQGKVVKATSLGEEREVVHLTLPNARHYTVQWVMTDLKYLDNIQANAVHILDDKSKRIDDYVGTTFFQPLQADIFE